MALSASEKLLDTVKTDVIIFLLFINGYIGHFLNKSAVLHSSIQVALHGMFNNKNKHTTNSIQVIT